MDVVELDRIAVQDGCAGRGVGPGRPTTGTGAGDALRGVEPAAAGDAHDRPAPRVRGRRRERGRRPRAGGSGRGRASPLTHIGGCGRGARRVRRTGRPREEAANHRIWAEGFPAARRSPFTSSTTGARVGRRGQRSAYDSTDGRGAHRSLGVPDASDGPHGRGPGFAFAPALKVADGTGPLEATLRLRAGSRRRGPGAAGEPRPPTRPRSPHHVSGEDRPGRLRGASAASRPPVRARSPTGVPPPAAGVLPAAPPRGAGSAQGPGESTPRRPGREPQAGPEAADTSSAVAGPKAQMLL